jgi:hypothetical protein
MVIISLALIGLAGAVDYFVKIDNVRIAPFNLSGTDSSVFERPFFTTEYRGVDDMGTYLTPSQMEFISDKGDGIPMGNVSPKRAFVGSVNKLN